MLELDTLLGAALEAGLGVLAEAGFGDDARDLKERLTHRAEKERRAAFERAFDQAAQAAGEESIRPLLEHAPFREAVVAGLLDAEQGFDLKALTQAWGEQLPAHTLTLRRFFNTLEHTLLGDDYWGPLLERYQELRFREDVLAELRQRNLDVPPRQVVTALNAHLSGSGGLAQGAGAAAAGAGGVAMSGTVLGDIIHTIVQRLVVERVEVSMPVTAASRPGPESLRAAYLERLFETAGRLSLAGVDPKAASQAETQLSLGAVYTALLTLSIETPEHPAAERETRHLSALAELDRHARLVLLGDPGSGKSTFVNFIALCLAGEALGQAGANLERLTAPLPDDEGDDQPERQPWRHGALLPVRVILRDFAARGLPVPGERATAEHLWRFIVAELKAAALSGYVQPLSRELIERGGLLLLDGLDEVPEAGRRREQIKQAVADFAATFRRCRVLVTSRTYAYQQQAWRLPGFAETLLAPFSAGQVRRFVDSWYAHVAALRGMHPDDAQGRAELLKRAIFGSDRLAGLAERPLLLTLMASLHAWRGGSLPEKREELYADTVDLLLDWWESPKVVRDARGEVSVEQPSLAEWLRVDRARVRDMLNELAYRAHAAQPELLGTADVAEGELVCSLMRLSQNPDVNPARLVEYLSQRAGLLLPRGVGVYTFPHRTFQEYMAACYLTDHDYPDQVAGLARGEPTRWREVVLLAGAKAARGSAFGVWALADALCYREPGEEASGAPDVWGAHLAGQALAETADLSRVGDKDLGKLERVRRWLVHILRAAPLPALERAVAGNSLARLGDPRFRADAWHLPDEPLLGFVEVPAGPFRMGTREEDIPALMERLGGEREWYEWEVPQHEVDLPAYYIACHPVTNAQFTAFVNAGGYHQQRFWKEAERDGVWQAGQVKRRWVEMKEGDIKELEESAEGPKDYGEPFNLPNHPVVGVTWYEALAYSRWLDEQLRGWEGAPGWLAGLVRNASPWQVRLPTEAEWEKAARGTDGRVYPWGKDADSNRANYADTGIGGTSAVGCFPGGASPYGVEDVSGNVWEWCMTKWQDSYKNYRNDNRSEGDDARVVRGGAFYYSARLVRCADRSASSPGRPLTYGGFRCVLAPGF